MDKRTKIRRRIGAFLTPLSLIVGISTSVLITTTAPTLKVPDCKGDLAAVGFCDHAVRDLTGLREVSFWAATIVTIILFVYGIMLWCTGRDLL